MNYAAGVRQRRDRDGVDTEAYEIGVLEAVPVDATTDGTATVRIGLPIRHRLVFVPIDDAIVGPGHLKRSSDATDRPTSPVRSANGNWRAADHLWTG
ncbi:hypothetical protein QFZ24_002556 [Streptomyces phaeochromogenes]|uniref:hypothetical protein n=1 Tax=Streptomyces phaeochromogenes TaxID=1923 RepID=UPI002794D815|nr:hypothetical protein [Streptomyces phaeochromogenes]